MARSTGILRLYATQTFLICPPHLLNVAALPWEILITSFEHFGRCFLQYYVLDSERANLSVLR